MTGNVTSIEMSENGTPMLIEYEDTMINEKFKDKILKRIKANNGFCPCVDEKSNDTMCPCKDYQDTHDCHCNLYIKVAKK
jgi:ferredoxin-thioredoxin reductase catalytic subunit